jgi:hypothetical protein
MDLREELERLNVVPILISADPPERNKPFWVEKRGVPWPVLSDPDHAVADSYGIPISRKHPAARSYSDGFIQPAVLVYQGEQELFRFIAIPKFTNLWGAARRPTPAQVLDAIRPGVEAAKA